MKLRAAQCATLSWDEGKLVWDGYLEHAQIALTAPSELLMRWFADWRELDTVGELGDERYREIAEGLVSVGVLIEEGSERDEREKEVLERWGTWGPDARYFHFASRELTGTRFTPREQDMAATRDRIEQDPPPPYATERTERELVSFPDGEADDAGWPRARLLDAARARRTIREYADAPIQFEQLARLVELAAGITEVTDELGTGPAVFKTAPSAGAWHSVELYVHARRVDGLDPGVYHYAATRNGFERIGSEPDGFDLLQALGGQKWLAESPALILYSSMIERPQWRYKTSRAYRDILLGLGHLSQTLLLAATAMGLGTAFATAVVDEDLERLIDCDPLEEVLLGVTALGHAA